MPAPSRLRAPSKYMIQCSDLVSGGGSCISVHSATKSASAWDLMVERGVNSIDVAKMASHVIFQYNVLAIDDTHNTWTNMIVKIGSSVQRTRIEEIVKKSKSKRSKQR